MTKCIYLPGEPIPQKRPRIFAKGAMDPCWEAKEQHRSYIKDHYQLETINFATKVTFIFSYSYLKTAPKKRKIPHFKTTRPDIDNLCKYILDMGNDLLWEDDSFITSISAFKIFSDEPSTTIIIHQPEEMMVPLTWIGIAKG